MKDIVQVLKTYQELDKTKKEKDYIIILAQYRYKPRFYVQNKDNEEKEYFDIVRKPALIDVYNDFYFYDEKMLSIVFKQKTVNCFVQNQNDNI